MARENPGGVGCIRLWLSLTGELSDQIMAESRPEFSIGLASLLKESAQGRALPPVEHWNPAHCGDIDIRIARDGTWYHLGRPILRHHIVRLFSTILRKEADGYHLVTPVEKLRIKVEDAPFVAVLLRCEGAGLSQRLVFTTNVGDEVELDAAHLLRVVINPNSGEPSPYVHVRGGLEAKLSRAVFYQLVELAETDAHGVLGVKSNGHYFVLGQG